jgi:DNA-binding SARP family transcriptional activator/tetratricopeptide (TPR) repeat protein
MSDPSAVGRSSTPGVAFRILGPLEVAGPSGAVRIPPGRQEVILAALLLEVNRVVSTDYLVDLIWDEDPPDTARTQVQICVSRLRKSLGNAQIDAPITTRPPGYLMRAAEDTLDLNVFNRRVARSRILVKEGRAAEAAELLRGAVGLWRGPSLNGIPSDTLRTKALRLDEERLTATEDYLQLELGLGRHHQLVGEVGRLLDEQPLRERLRGQLMLALYRSGRQAEALETYRTGRAMLVEELGLEPGESLRLLETAILSGDSALHLGPEPFLHTPFLNTPFLHTGLDPGDAAPAPPAERTPGRDDDAPPCAPPPEPPYRQEKPHQLPADTADFVDGEELIRSVEDVITGKDGRRVMGVVVIVGRPGVGKSTMATHIAHRVADEHFPDGQLYCDLRGTSPGSVGAKDVLGRFLRALGIPGPVIPDSLDERAEMYRTLLATRRVLVVLDDAATESQISPLLPGGGSCAVLVTSRARLTGVPGAKRIELDVLDAVHALELLAQVVGRDRVEREPEAAAALVRTVGGLPLALRIVAARLAARPHWSLASMVHRLASERHRLDELAHGEMTMRATLSLTYDGLGRSDRQLLRLLSLSQGPSLPGWLAGALLDDHRPCPSDLLEPLVDVQMLDVVSVEDTGEFRYRFHEIIRLFALEQLAAHDGETVRQAAAARMLGGWMALAEQAHRRIYGGDYTVLHGGAPRWQPPPEYVADLLADPIEWLDREQANLCCAVEQAAHARMDELCWDLATTLVTLFESRGYLDQWDKTHRQALDAVRLAGNKRGTAALLSSLGTLHMSRSQPDKSRRALESALEIFDELGDPHGLALCRRDLALLERQRGDDDRARLLYEHAIRGFEQVGDIVGKATALTQCSHIWMRRGHIATAHAQLEEALEIYRSVGYVGGQARALRRVGQVLLQRGEGEEAERTLTQVLAMVRESGDLIGEGHLLRNLGEVNTDLGRYEQAKEFFDRALAVRERIMDHGGAAIVRLDLARLLAGRRDAVLVGGGPARDGFVGDLLDEAIAVFRHRDMSRELREAEQLRAAL